MGDNFSKISNSVITNRSSVTNSNSQPAPNDDALKAVNTQNGDHWYKRPVGILLLMVIGGLLLALSKKVLGL
jgi:hypothetical protein